MEKRRPPDASRFSCEGVRVLAVDDEEMNLVVAKGVLGSYGIQVDTCLSGKEAIERCAKTSYDIIFLDHMMPGFDGVETLKQLREMNNGRYQKLPVIALTDQQPSAVQEKCSETKDLQNLLQTPLNAPSWNGYCARYSRSVLFSITKCPYAQRNRRKLYWKKSLFLMKHLLQKPLRRIH